LVNHYREKAFITEGIAISKEDVIKLEGKIVDVLPSTTYRVKLENFEKPVLATLSGKMRQNNIKVINGDTVDIEFSPYDLTRGRIVRRK
jgi:translation initiation factor IF-1